MNDLHLCSALAATEFEPPKDVIFRVNDHYCDCIIFDAYVRTTAQFWRAVYTWYCATHYITNPSSSITLTVRWNGEDKVELPFPSRQPLAEPCPSREFFRLLSERSPDIVRSGVPVNWVELQPLPRNGDPAGDEPAQPVEPTYEELL